MTTRSGGKPGERKGAIRAF